VADHVLGAVHVDELAAVVDLEREPDELGSFSSTNGPFFSDRDMVQVLWFRA